MAGFTNRKGPLTNDNPVRKILKDRCSSGRNRDARSGDGRHRHGVRHQNDAQDAHDHGRQSAQRDHHAQDDDRTKDARPAQGDRRPQHAPDAIHHGARMGGAFRREHRGEPDDQGALPQPPSPGLGPYGDQNGGSCVSGQRGYRVGVLEVCQQLGKATGVLKKEPAHHCLKPRRPAINAGLSFAGSAAGTVAALPYQL